MGRWGWGWGVADLPGCYRTRTARPSARAWRRHPRQPSRRLAGSRSEFHAAALGAGVVRRGRRVIFFEEGGGVQGVKNGQRSVRSPCPLKRPPNTALTWAGGAAVLARPPPLACTLLSTQSMHRRALLFLAWLLENLAVVRLQAEQTCASVEAAFAMSLAARPASAADGDAAEWGWSIASVVRRQRGCLSEGQRRPQRPSRRTAADVAEETVTSLL